MAPQVRQDHTQTHTDILSLPVWLTHKLRFEDVGGALPRLSSHQFCWQEGSTILSVGQRAEFMIITSLLVSFVRN